MTYLRNTKKSTKYFWVVLLSLVLLCAQEVKLHIHSLGHDHHNQHDHQHQSLTDDHSHVSIAHLSLDDSHSEHHDQVLYEGDASPDCLLTKLSNKAPLTGLLSLLFILLLIGVYRYTFERRHEAHIHLSYRFHFTPPLRAPPF